MFEAIMVVLFWLFVVAVALAAVAIAWQVLMFVGMFIWMIILAIIGGKDPF